MTSVLVQWNGDSFDPHPRHKALCDKAFVVGEFYSMEPRERRSEASHRHYFACIREAWQNLPENISDQFRTPEHLRKFALIKAGFHNSRSVHCGSAAAAKRVAAFAATFDEYSIVTAEQQMVVIYTAKSQSRSTMDHDAFQRSKEAVLEIISQMAGVSPADLSKNSGQAA